MYAGSVAGGDSPARATPLEAASDFGVASGAVVDGAADDEPAAALASDFAGDAGTGTEAAAGVGADFSTAAFSTGAAGDCAPA
ncbi:MAG: hypothetical protein IT520_00810 [Burkholderiales bacterium]|nr:hypothetical protein [Burkholderiales bacterium]